MRPLVHVEEVAHAVACAVQVVEVVVPQEVTGQSIELRAPGALREVASGQCDVPLHYQREVAFLPRRKVAQRDGAGDVGRAVEVLGTRVDEQESAAGNGGVALGGSRVVDDGAVLVEAGDGGEALAHVEVLLRAELTQFFGYGNLGHFAAVDILFEPAEEANQSYTVANHGLAGAGQLSLVLDALEQGNGRLSRHGGGVEFI